MNWQKVKKDLLLATTSHFFDKIVGYLVIVMLTRYLDKGEMGQLFFAATLVSFFALFAELGTNKYLIREVATTPEKALGYFSEVISLRIPLLFACFVLLNVFTAAFKADLITIMLFTSVYVLLEEFYYSFSALLLGLKRVAYRIITSMSAKALLVVLVYIVVTYKGSLNAVLACYVLANVVLVSFAIWMVQKKIGYFGLVWRPEAMRKALQISFPFFVLTILGLLQFKVDTVMLGFIHSYAAVATYEAGFKLLEVSRFIIRPAGMIFFPICSELATKQNWSELHQLLRKMLIITGTLGSVATLVIITMANFIVPFVFGPKYNDAIPILRVLYLSAPALYMGMIVTFLANAIHLERKAINVLAVGVVVNITLNSLAIPLWGALGAAWTTVISETLLTIWLITLNVQKLQALSTNLSNNIWTISRRWVISFVQK